jgi:hypothetical protein
VYKYTAAAMQCPLADIYQGEQMTVDNHNIRAALRAWMNRHQWDIAATLTFADAYSAKQAHQAVMKFWNETDYQLYGNASRRRNLKCERVMFLEGDGEIQHHHYHAAIKCPETHGAEIQRFCGLLTRRWLKLHPRCQRVEFKPVTDSSGWIHYSTKQISRTDCDRMDVYSSHIAATQLENVRHFSTQLAA